MGEPTYYPIYRPFLFSIPTEEQAISNLWPVFPVLTQRECPRCGFEDVQEENR